MSDTIQLDAVFGSPSANAYATVNEAAAYLNRRYGGAAWDSLEGSRPAAEAEAIRARLLITATHIVDTAQYRYGRFFAHRRGFAREQALKFPWAAHPYLFLSASGGTVDTIEVASLVGTETYAQDFFAGGAVHVRRGTNRHRARTVDSFDPQAGTLTVSEPFDEEVDSTTEFYLVWPPDSALVEAVIEQAYHLLLSNPDGDPAGTADRAELIASGVASYSVGGLSESFSGADGSRRDGVPMLCNVARLLLRPYTARSASAGRA